MDGGMREEKSVEAKGCPWVDGKSQVPASTWDARHGQVLKQQFNPQFPSLLLLAISNSHF
jgi:hypothetical protein